VSTPAYLIQFLRRAVLGWTLQPAGAFPGPVSGPAPFRYENTGGPRSRVVSSPVISRPLSEGSETLGLQPVGDYQLPRHPANGLRDFVFGLLQRAGFLTPEEAWEAHAAAVPGGVALVVDLPHGRDAADAGDAEEQLRTALVLGKCSGSLYSPQRPLIWSERRLARSVRLVHCDAGTFTNSDHD